MGYFVWYGIPMLAAILLPFIPRLLAVAIIVLDAVWVLFLIAIISWFNPEGPSWDTETIRLTVVAAFPLIIAASRLVSWAFTEE
jgi:hypothetical protein